MVSGRVLLKINETVGFSYFWGSKNKKNEKNMENWNELGRIVVPGALNRSIKKSEGQHG